MQSPGSWTVEGLFDGRPVSLLLFQEVRRFIESLGPVNIGATKTQVSFGTTRKFAWVWLPQTYTKNDRKTVSPSRSISGDISRMTGLLKLLNHDRGAGHIM